MSLLLRIVIVLTLTLSASAAMMPNVPDSSGARLLNPFAVQGPAKSSSVQRPDHHAARQNRKQATLGFASFLLLLSFGCLATIQLRFQRRTNGQQRRQSYLLLEALRAGVLHNIHCDLPFSRQARKARPQPASLWPAMEPVMLSRHELRAYASQEAEVERVA